MSLLDHPVILVLVAGAGYFLAAKVGVRLLAPGGVAVFWPASGLAAGLMAALGRNALGPIATGVFAATVAANLMSDRNLGLALAFGACNAAEAALFAILLTHSWSAAFRFRDLPATAWFFIATALSTAAAAAVAALTILLTNPLTDQFWKLWQAWFAADAVGIVTLAPLIITAMRAIRRPPSLFEIVEGVIATSLLLFGIHLLFSQSEATARWTSQLPILLLFPMQLWMAARCRAVFPAIGIALLGILIVWSTISGFGRFGDPSIPLPDRIIGAQLALCIVALCSLMLVSVVVERQTVETDLRASEERFTKLAATAPGLIYSFRDNGKGQISLPYASPGIVEVLGFAGHAVRDDAQDIFKCFHPDDYGPTVASIEVSARTLTAWHREFRYMHPDRGEIWLECHSNPVREADGGVIWHGIAQDITERKKADEHVRTLLGEVNHRSKNLLSVVKSVATHTITTPERFAETFSQRIAALAASHDLLINSQWHGVGLDTLIRSQLGHFRGLIGTRIRVSGSELALKPNAAQSIGMALHELATNAGKYGALVGDHGTIDIRWSCGEHFMLSWSERDGPHVCEPTRTGFGHRLLIEMAEHELDGDVRLAYPPSGLEWSVTAPKDAILESAAAPPKPA